MLNMLLNPINTRRARRLRDTSPNRTALADIPSTLYTYWKSAAHKEFAGIPRDAFFFTAAADTLLTFFECVRRSGKACALPSKAADSVWHAWLRMSPAGLDAFCEKRFGQIIPHVESAGMPVPIGVGLAHCLVEARKLGGINPEGPDLPELFAADRRLCMPNGYAYSVIRGTIVCGEMDRFGREYGPGYPQATLTPAALLASGLIGQNEYTRYEELALERQHSRCEHGTYYSGCGSSGSSCGSVSCDGGGGGGGDGGGCGSGCGGGGGGD